MPSGTGRLIRNLASLVASMYTIQRPRRQYLFHDPALSSLPRRAFLPPALETQIYIEFTPLLASWEAPTGSPPPLWCRIAIAE